MSDKPVKLPAKYKEMATNYMLVLKPEKATFAQAAKKAAAACETVKKALLDAMNGASTATVGDMLLMCKVQEDVQAQITLQDGRKIKWDMVSSVMVGNELIPREKITSIYGGRSGSTDLDIVLK